MTDIEKVKIEVLRDALKDASATIRALDKKISFLVSYNAIFLGVISTIFINYKNIALVPNSTFFYGVLTLVCLIWITVFILIMISISPKVNPTEVFKSEADKTSFHDTFFIFTNGKKNSLDLNQLSKNYSLVDNYEKMENLLYNEIGIVSYIRDIKMNNVNTIVKRSWILTLIFVITIFSFGINAFLAHNAL